jgi:4-hydroxy-tetrahydrodipicolinate reductase
VARKNETIRVAVVGACGRMGREVTKGVLSRPNLQLVAAVDVREVGKDIGEIVDGKPIGIPVSNDLVAALKESGAQVAVDFTHPSVVFENVKAMLECGVAPVVGTTGWTLEKVKFIDRLAKRKKLPAIIAPNFAIGAVLMMKFAMEAAKYFDKVEIIELHHDGKADAPSGTALRTAELILKARSKPFPEPKVKKPEVLLDGVLGGEMDGIRIHSVRLPGLVAHQEVIFGTVGQVLTIRHDSLSRESFIPGVLLAIEKVLSLPPGVVFGLENLL